MRPLFFYLPWGPAGLVLAVVLTVRLRRVGNSATARSARWALAWLLVALVAKAVLGAATDAVRSTGSTGWPVTGSTMWCSTRLSRSHRRDRVLEGPARQEDDQR